MSSQAVTYVPAALRASGLLGHVGRTTKGRPARSREPRHVLASVAQAIIDYARNNAIDPSSWARAAHDDAGREC
jgi:hypothetical protein